MNDYPLGPSSAGIPNEMAEAIAAYALEALPDGEEETVVAYLAAHPEANVLLEEYRSVVGLLPYAAAPSTPPAHMRESVLRSIQGERIRRRQRANLFSFPSFRPRFAPVIAACLMLGLLVWNVGLQLHVNKGQPTPFDDAAAFFGTPGLITYEMLPDPAVPGASGRIYLSSDRKQTAFAVAGLPALSSDQTYQLWFRLPDQSRVSIATFGVDQKGSAVMVLPVPADGRTYVSCGITREPRGGSPTPTGPRMLASGQWPVPSLYS